jgi:hypothetical protein
MGKDFGSLVEVGGRKPADFLFQKPVIMILELVKLFKTCI